MELWIRSQDKERLIKPIDFYIEETLDHINKTSEFGIYCLNLANDDIKIGIYKTKERALEVLDDIQNHLRYSKIAEIINEGFFRYLDEVCRQERANKILDNISVYEMPEE